MAVQVKKGNEEVTQKQKAPVTPVAPDDPNELAERVQKMISGRMQAPNEVMQYMVDQLRRVLSETDKVNKQMQQSRATLQAAERRASELKGMRDSYLEDLREWDARTRKTEILEEMEQADSAPRQEDSEEAVA